MRFLWDLRNVAACWWGFAKNQLQKKPTVSQNIYIEYVIFTLEINYNVESFSNLNSSFFSKMMQYWFWKDPKNFQLLAQ